MVRGERIDAIRSRRLVGHRGRDRGEVDPGSGDEQPLDAAALVAAEVEAFVATGEEMCARRAVRAFEWFLGRNRLQRSVYDFLRPAAATTASASPTSTATRAPSRRPRLPQALLALDAAGLRDAARMKVALSGRSRGARPRATTDRGARDGSPGRRARAARRRRHAVRHAGFDHLARLDGVCARPYEEDDDIDGRVWEALHVAHALGRSSEFDLIHNHLDWLPLAFAGLAQAPMVTTIHGFSSPQILPAYRRLGKRVRSDLRRRSPAGARLRGDRPSRSRHGPAAVLRHAREAVCFGRIHPDKGTAQAIDRRGVERPLVLCGPVQDARYFAEEVEPHVDGERVRYLGSVGQADRAAVLGSASCLLHPIAFAEPFGLSVVESMLCGTPVVAYAAGRCPSSSRTA